MKLLGLLDSLKGVRVLIAGDLILDRYVYGRVERISPEAPVPVLGYEKEEWRLGGAANVAANVAAVGGRPVLAGIAGRDEAGERLMGMCISAGLDTSSVIRSERPTSIKTRFIASGQQLLRMDREVSSACSAHEQLALIAAVRQADFQAAIVSDYGKGVVNSAILAEVTSSAKVRMAPVIVDPKKKNFDVYHNVTAMTPNRDEAEHDSGLRIEDEASAVKAANILIEKHNLEHILITLGAKGMALCAKNADAVFIPTSAREVFDVSGAGDTVIAVYSAALGAKAGLSEAARLANLAAGIVVGLPGTVPVPADALRVLLTESAV